MRKVEEVSEAIRKSEGPLADIEAKFDQFMLTLPNLPNLAVKVGSNEGENREVRRLGESPKFDFTSKNHWDIGEELGILDFAGAAKIAGARAHQLHAGLTHWRGRLTEMLPPALVNRGSLVGTGQLPKSTRIYFISLPAIIFSFRPPRFRLRTCTATKCSSAKNCRSIMWPTVFSSEAGSYGKYVRGLIRQHQFSKVEMVKLTELETAYDELESMVRNAEEVLRRLELPYRVVELCTGDLGFASAKTYDLEVWAAGTDYLSRDQLLVELRKFPSAPGQLRYRKDKKGRPLFVHTLNGSGLSFGRTLVAVLENYQQKDGSVIIPEALRT